MKRILTKTEKTFIAFAAKLTVIALIIGLNWVGLSAIGETAAYFDDTENSTDNIFLAGEVDFLLNASSFSPTTTAISLSPEDITRKNIDVDPQDSNPFKYVASTENVTGDTDFCDVLNVEAELEGISVYDDYLVDMLTDATTTLDSWEFTIGMGAENFQNKICNFDTQYSGSQTRHDYDLGGGFNDTEIEENIIASWGFRINKVYYDVAPERGEEGANEWVEIYNQTNIPLDIDGWELCDNSSCDVLSASSTIPAQGFGFIVASSTTASNILPAYWYIPEEVVEIGISSSRIGNGLHNNADMLVLKRSDGVIIDQMNWGDPDEGWTNWNKNVWDPGATDVAEGSALARSPNGYDTNQPSDFIELEPPTLDLIYPDEGGSYRWSWGSTKDIEWVAVNNNGPDEDLDISLFYVKDINHDDVISNGDIMLTIAETTENDGLYEWTVPSGFLGFIWIYLVGTGPENPMLNSGTISGDIWDPPAEIFLASGDETTPENIDIAGNTAEEVRDVVVYDPAFGIPEVITSADLLEEEVVIEEEPVVATSDGSSGEASSSGDEPVVESTTETATTTTATTEEFIEITIEDTTATSTATTTEEIIVEEFVEGTLIEEINSSIGEEETIATTTTTEMVAEEIIEIILEETIATSTATIIEEILPVEETPAIEEETIVVEEEPVTIEEEVILPEEEPAIVEPEILPEPVQENLEIIE